MAGDDVEAANDIAILENGNVIELQQSRIDNGEPSRPLVFNPGRRERKNTGQSSQSQFSRRTANSINRVRTWFRGRSSIEPEPPSSDEDDQARDEFLRLIAGQSATDECRFYARFLERKFRSAWAPLLRPVLVGISDYSNEPLAGEIAVAYRFMTLVARRVLGGHGLALCDIVDELQNASPPRAEEERHLSVPSQTAPGSPRQQIPQQGSSDDLQCLLKDQGDLERMIPYQLSFAAVGWLTLLIDPVVRPHPDMLEIRRFQTTNLGRYIQPNRTFTTYSTKMGDLCDHSIFLLLKKFGNVIPDTKDILTGEAQVITASCVCFSTLHKVAGIKIEWVNTLSEHLEFDSIRKILKVFRFPSFCKMMYQDRTLISGFYEDAGRWECGTSDSPIDLTPAYFREILVSYRLIFGQDSSSPKVFKSQWKKSSRSSPPAANPTPPTTLLPAPNPPRPANDNSDLDLDLDAEADPLLQLLCAKYCESPEARAFYGEIHALDISPYYYPEDFPFLRRRILNLQSFVQGRSPHTLRALWNDKRNISFWWTFWAVLFIGGGTILISFLQLAFAIWSSWAGQRQVELTGNNGNNGNS